MISRQKKSLLTFIVVLIVLGGIQYQYVNFVLVQLGIGSLSIELERHGADVSRNDTGIINYVAFDGLPLDPQHIRYVKQIGAVEILSLSGARLAEGVVTELEGLEYVVYLSLYRTNVTDSDLSIVAGLPRLSQLYVGETEVTDAGVQALSKLRPDIEIFH